MDVDKKLGASSNRLRPLTFNQADAGSNPVAPTKLKCKPERCTVKGMKLLRHPSLGLIANCIYEDGTWGWVRVRNQRIPETAMVNAKRMFEYFIYRIAVAEANLEHFWHRDIGKDLPKGSGRFIQRD